MKFISKNSNLRVVLIHGIPGSPIVGREAVPGLSVKFEDGVAIVKDPAIQEKMLAHPSFNQDFILADEAGVDPFLRKSIEPEHDIQEIQYGHVGKNINPKPAIPLTPEVKKMLTDMAMEMAKKMAPQIAKTLVHDVLKDMQKDKEAATVAEGSEQPEETDTSKTKKTRKADKTE